MRESIEKARELTSNTTRQYRELKDILRSDIVKVETDKLLSTEGKMQEKTKVRAAFAKDIVRLSAEIKKAYKDELTTAKTKAEKILTAGLKVPDENTVKRYERNLADIKSEVILSTDAKSAQAKLEKFISGINDAYLADMVARSFPDILSNITAKGNVEAEVIGGLRSLHVELSERFKTEEQIEAAQVYETASQMEDASVFEFAVTEDLKRNFGYRVSMAVTNPEGVDVDELPVFGNVAL